MDNLQSQDYISQSANHDPNLNLKNFISLSDQIAQNHQWDNSAIHAIHKDNIKIFEPSQTTESDRNSDRIHEPLPFFIIHVIIACGMSFQNVFIVYGVGQNYETGIKIILGNLFFIILFSFLNSIYLVSFKTLVPMYTLLDGVLVAQIAALVGLVGSLMLAGPSTTPDYMLMVMIPVSFFFFVGNFRVCIRFADWNRAKIIVYKLAILAGAVCFFEIGAYFMAVNYSYTKGLLQELDLKIKDFITLYAFGTFEFFRQIFAKICDFDQTADLKYTYQFKKVSKDSNRNGDNKIQMLEIQNN